ncbi:unnamed protein product, partial [Rotaria magnacalcarata]
TDSTLCDYNGGFYTYTDFCALHTCTNTYYTNHGTHTTYTCSCNGCSTLCGCGSGGCGGFGFGDYCGCFPGPGCNFFSTCSGCSVSHTPTTST